MANQKLEAALSGFLAQFADPLDALAHALDAACVSHYSACLGHRLTAFEIFPASAYVREIRTMLTLDRPYYTRPMHSFRDASPRGDYNPAETFLLYLRRWAGFAEQVMKREGNSKRGVAAARAKLLIDELQKCLSAPPSRNGVPSFAAIMRQIGAELEQRHRAIHGNPHVTGNDDNNYERAMSAARALYASEA